VKREAREKEEIIMAEVIIKMKDQPGKQNLAVTIDFNPELVTGKAMTPAQAAAVKFLEALTKQITEG
jgi:hypothetical protein